MLGLEALHIDTKMAFTRGMDRYYGKGFLEEGRFEDMVLATPERRKWADIGTDWIPGSVLQYILDNYQWINVCLFVNADFRDCFRDAVLIEKALLQVSRKEYLDFREEMTLASEANRGVGDDRIGINLSAYDLQTAMAMDNMVEAGMKNFYRAGMSEAYATLLGTLDPDAMDGTKFAAYNIIYVANAMARNGVFRKYVSIVIENVKKQLSE